MNTESKSTNTVQREMRLVAKKIYRAHLPPYLKQPWARGRGKCYEDWLKEQLKVLVMDEVFADRGRLEELKMIQKEVSLVFGLFATSFRILDHFGMHLRAQTLGQYELWPEDEKLLVSLCRKFLKSKGELDIRSECPMVSEE